MFQPASLKGTSPVPIDQQFRSRLIFLYLLVIILSLLPFITLQYCYFYLLWRPGFHLIFFMGLPLNGVISIYILQLSACIFSSLLLLICKLIYKPKVGIFHRNRADKDYCYWNIRNAIKKWPLFLSATNPLPWLKNRFTLRFFGVKIGKNTICDNAWISSELVEIGTNVIIGMGASILSFGIEQDKLIIKNTRVEDDVLIGAKSVLLPGTIVEKGVKLSAHSSTDYDQVLKADKIYSGNPAKLKDL